MHDRSVRLILPSLLFIAPLSASITSTFTIPCQRRRSSMDLISESKKTSVIDMDYDLGIPENLLTCSACTARYM